LQEQHLKELRETFHKFDAQNKGHLSVRELGACCRCFGYVATEADLQEMVNEVGGKVDFQQFAHIMTKKMKDCDIISEIKQAFRELDNDNDGFINTAELKVAMEKLMGKELRAVEVEEVMREADVDGDGKISQHDFVSILTL